MIALVVSAMALAVSVGTALRCLALRDTRAKRAAARRRPFDRAEWIDPEFDEALSSLDTYSILHEDESARAGHLSIEFDWPSQRSFADFGVGR